MRRTNYNMKYLGGKFYNRKQIARVLELLRKPGQTYFEPFCGGGWVLQEMTGRRIACDKHEALINMYKAIQTGWNPPPTFTEDEYNTYKIVRNPKDPMTAFVGFGCSFGGKYYGGFASKANAARNYYEENRRWLLNVRPALRDVQFFPAASYNWHRPDGMLIYCDPPYSDTTEYSAGSSNNAEFWQTMREWSARNTVVVSEYKAPPDFTCIWQREIKLSVRSKSGCEPRIEKLFMYDPGAI